MSSVHWSDRTSCQWTSTGTQVVSKNIKGNADLKTHCGACMCDPQIHGLKNMRRSEDTTARELMKAYYIMKKVDACISDTSVCLFFFVFFKVINGFLSGFFWWNWLSGDFSWFFHFFPLQWHAPLDIFTSIWLRLNSFSVALVCAPFFVLVYIWANKFPQDHAPSSLTISP